MENKKIFAYLDGANPNDKRSWSGIPYNLVQQLKRFYDVDAIWLQESFAEKAYCLAYKMFWRLLGKHNDPRFSTFYARLKGRQVSKILSAKQYDCVFFRGSNLAAYAKTAIPTRVYFSDACFHQMVDYYIFHLTESNIAEGNEVQRRAMEVCNVNVFASNWAMKDAIDFYQIPKQTCHLGYFGASVDTTEFKKQSHNSNLVNLLFVGVEWERKGGEIAVECTKLLNQKDPSKKYVLHFVGCNPPYEIKDENIKFYGFLNRNIPEQAQQMISLREQADLFILPTRAECAGIVFCESSAYGIPSITFDTGGIGDYVLNGENGYRLPMGSTADDFANKILDILSDTGKLEYMQKKSVEMYKERMNWDALGDRFKELID